jgi:hypothetical protein
MGKLPDNPLIAWCVNCEITVYMIDLKVHTDQGHQISQIDLLFTETAEFFEGVERDAGF